MGRRDDEPEEHNRTITMGRKHIPASSSISYDTVHASVLLLLYLQFISQSNAFIPRVTTSSQRIHNSTQQQWISLLERCNRISTSAVSSANASNSDDDNNNYPTSIGDVVQNLHGGKYQFSQTQYLAGNSVVGQAFAERLYSSGDAYVGSGDGCGVADGGLEDDEMPKWALRLQDPMEFDKLIRDTLTFSSNENMHSISISNEERSWERYYSFILSKVSNIANTADAEYTSPLFRIAPTTGQLAPRGGAANACDESKPYLDSATVSVEFIVDDSVERGDEDWMLVVGTEAETWRYLLKID